LTLGVGAMPADGRTPARPDLRVSAISMQSATVRPGAVVDIRVTTHNAGGRRAAGTLTMLFLSRDLRWDKKDRRLTSIAVARLKPHKKSLKTFRMTVPATTAPGAERVLACADGSRKVKELREGNNCRAAQGVLTVAAAPFTPGSQLQPPDLGQPSAGGQTPGAGGSSGNPTTPPVADDDGDGYTNAVDCAPNNPAVNPGAPDRPDVPGFTDTNCDGMDGDASRAVFVSPTGDDANAGTTRSQPKRTLAAAVAAAEGLGDDVYATSGVYAERLSVANGVDVVGGYSADWATRSLAAETRITGSSGSAAVAVNATAPTLLQLLTLAPGAPVGFGASSYGLRAVGSPGLVVERVSATASAGNGGAGGGNGAPGQPGGPGQPGVTGECDRFQGPGGAGGTSPVGRTGGAGGFGGSQGANTGQGGFSGLVVGGGGGAGGPGGAGGTTGHTGGAGNNGDPGSRGSDGSGGAGGFSGSGTWTTSAGGTGGNGTNGHGGGGGGGGGGQGGTFVNDGGGNGGGGGGGGGEGGHGGGGGGGGGGSFGVFLVNSSGATVIDSVIAAGNGGPGGNGGSGGSAGAGGSRGLGATYCTSEIGAGGNGGVGGAGGLGGHGGGGAGGPSIALYTTGGVTTSGNSLSFATGGAGGGSSGNAGTAGVALAATP
jgi:hypothetical protein